MLLTCAEKPLKKEYQKWTSVKAKFLKKKKRRNLHIRMLLSICSYTRSRAPSLSDMATWASLCARDQASNSAVVMSL
ncbi:hypothetical protein EYF80_010824 [Liparis tanakae]|uniref:Uncharacterized protein n=1 Tax=Liparis tanakae TaxID=230148 RepID=A0A4Z2IME1_9TELE|nr:hypothetical protein EYF80_010824 [Liparis tanakae]